MDPPSLRGPLEFSSNGNLSPPAPPHAVPPRPAVPSLADPESGTLSRARSVEEPVDSASPVPGVAVTVAFGIAGQEEGWSAATWALHIGHVRCRSVSQGVIQPA